MMNRWFTHYLHGIKNDVEHDSPVQIVREHQYTTTSYDSYPDAKSSDVSFFLKSDKNNSGLLILNKIENQSYDTIIDDYRFKGEKLINIKNEKHRMLYVTPVLEKDIRISGIPRVSIRLSSSKPEVNLTVWLISLPWEKEKGTKIYDNLITRAWADPQNYKSLTKGEPLKSGEFYDVSLST